MNRTSSANIAVSHSVNAVTDLGLRPEPANTTDVGVIQRRSDPENFFRAVRRLRRG